MNFVERLFLRKVTTDMLNNVFSHWKTTLAGIGIAALQVVLNGRSTKQLVVALLAALVGAIAKDPTSKENK